MNTIRNQAPQQLSTAAHIAGAIAAIAVIVSGVAFASAASHDAVETAQAAIAPHVLYVTLPSVEIAGKRQAAEVADACTRTAQI